MHNFLAHIRFLLMIEAERSEMHAYRNVVYLITLHCRCRVSASHFQTEYTDDEADQLESVLLRRKRFYR